MGTFGSTLGAFRRIGEDLRGPQGSFWQTVAAKSMFLGGLLEASGSIGEHVNGAQSLFWHTVATKSMVLREALRGLLEGLGTTDKETRGHLGIRL